MNDVIIIIPARIGSVRLPKKMLKKIQGISVIEHVYKSIHSHKIVDEDSIYVATDSMEICEVIHNVGGRAIMTSSSPVSGTDRVYEAFSKIRKERPNLKYVVNVQGDMPFISAEIVSEVIRTIKMNDCDIATVACCMDCNMVEDPSNVKVVVNFKNEALYFSRFSIPYNSTKCLCHVGVYGFRVDSLEKFVNLPTGSLEAIEKLEQLRALEYGMKIKVSYTDNLPIAIDTYQDLELARININYL